MSDRKSRKVDRESGSKDVVTHEKACFVIMPFGGWFDRYYSDVYCPAIADAGLRHRRADDLFRPSTIVKDIWEMIKSASLVLADLTGKNPNVLYELGLAHAIAKPVVIVTETLEDIPFDLRALRIIEYDKNSPNWGSNMRVTITKAIKETLQSPLSAVMPTFLEPASENLKGTISEHDINLLEIRRDLDLLKNQFRPSVVFSPNFTTLTPKDIDEFILEMIKNGSPPDVMRAKLIALGFSVEIVDKMLSDA